jgi:hypothetical protein
MERKRPIAWRKREYPWTPKKKDKTVVTSFAAIRSGVLPILDLNLQGKPELVYVDTRTKDGLAQYEAAVKRGTHS